MALVPYTWYGTTFVHLCGFQYNRQLCHIQSINMGEY